MNGSAVPAAVTQEARLTPIPGVGIFALGGRGAFCRLRRREKCCRAAAGEMHAAACGDAPLPGRGAKGGTGHPDLRPGFLYPLLRLPLTFRSAALPFGHAANVRGPQLKPRYNPERFDTVWGWLAFGFALGFRANKCAAAGSGRTDRTACVIYPDCTCRAGCPHPAAPLACVGLQRRIGAFFACCVKDAGTAGGFVLYFGGRMAPALRRRKG